MQYALNLHFLYDLCTCLDNTKYIVVSMSIVYYLGTRIYIFNRSRTDVRMSKSRLEGSHIKSRKTVVEIGPTQSKSAVYKKKTDKLKK